MEGGEWLNGAGRPSFSIIVKEQTQGTFMSTGHKQATRETTKSTPSRGKLGRKKPDFVCTAEYFL